MRYMWVAAASVAIILILRWAYQLMFGRPALTIARVSEAPPEAINQVQEPMTDADHQILAAYIDIVDKLAILNLGHRHGLTRTPKDLKRIQKIIDCLSEPSQQPEYMEAAGAVFSNLLAAEIGMEWIIVIWDQERVLSLRDPQTTVIVYPLSVILKRALNREPIDVAYLYAGIRDSILQLRADPRFVEEALAASKA